MAADKELVGRLVRGHLDRIMVIIGLEVALVAFVVTLRVTFAGLGTFEVDLE